MGFRSLFLIMMAPYLLLLSLLLLAPAVLIPPQPKPEENEKEKEEEEEEEGRINHPEEEVEINHPPTQENELPPLSTYDSLKRLGKALVSTPTLPTYIAIVLVVSGTLGFFDTSLAQHFVLSLGVSTQEAGLLFIIQIVVYICFSFFAAEIAYR